jgi:hypothetical protein
MFRTATRILLLALVLPALAGAVEDEPVYVAVFDFATVDESGGNATVLKSRPLGEQLADSVRLKLRRQPGWKVVDRLTTQDAAGPMDLDTTPRTLADLLANRLGAHVGLVGRVSRTGPATRAEIACVDLRKGAEPVWSKVFTDKTERAPAVLARQIVEAVVGRQLWRPPEYGDEPEPPADALGKPINDNGSFERGAVGWEPPDHVSTFIQQSGRKAYGQVLRIKTDLRREPWLAYRRALRFGQADPTRPPAIAEDRSYGSVAGLEGVHVRSDWLPARPGGRYWLTADLCPTTAPVRPDGMFFPKIFVKGFRRTPHARDGLPESALAELGLTPRQFADLPKDKQQAIIAADAEKHPMRYVREVYRWYLACRAQPGRWTHFAAPFPPRGGLPENVEFLQIQVYCYWPPGEYLVDNVHLYRAPGPESRPVEPPRTPNAGRTRDVLERRSQPPAAGNTTNRQEGQ